MRPERGLEIIEINRRGFDGASERLGAGARAIGDRDAPQPPMAGHLRDAARDRAGADQQEGLAREIAKGPLRRAKRRGRIGADAGGQTGLAAHPAAGAHGTARHVAKDGTKGPGLGGGLRRGANLTENLGLTQHSRIETAGNAEQMLHRTLGRADLGRVEHAGRPRRDDAAERADDVLGVVGRPIELDSIAGGEDERFGQIAVQAAQRAGPYGRVHHRFARVHQPGDADLDDRLKRRWAADAWRLIAALRPGRSRPNRNASCLQHPPRPTPPLYGALPPAPTKSRIDSGRGRHA